jgi:hypothetical protein
MLIVQISPCVQPLQKGWVGVINYFHESKDKRDSQGLYGAFHNVLRDYKVWIFLSRLYDLPQTCGQLQ